MLIHLPWPLPVAAPRQKRGTELCPGAGAVSSPVALARCHTKTETWNREPASTQLSRGAGTVSFSVARARCHRDRIVEQGATSVYSVVPWRRYCFISRGACPLPPQNRNVEQGANVYSVVVVQVLFHLPWRWPVATPKQKPGTGSQLPLHCPLAQVLFHLPWRLPFATPRQKRGMGSRRPLQWCPVARVLFHLLWRLPIPLRQGT